MKKSAPEQGEIASPADAESDEVEEIVAGFSDDERKKSRVIVEAHRVEFRGPIPPPETLAKYQDINPDIPRQIIEMARARQDYIHNAHKCDQETRHTLQRRGQILSFIVAAVSLLGGIGLGVALVAIGHIWLGVILSAGTLINTALIFVKGEILFRFFDSGKKQNK